MVCDQRSVADQLQQYCDLFGHAKATIWDRYEANNRPALVHKLNCIFGSPVDENVKPAESPEESPRDGVNDAIDDDQADDLLNSDDKTYEKVFDCDGATKDESKLDRKFVQILDAIWNQRKYCNGVLLMSPIYVACVPNDVHSAKGLEATDYHLRPVFRIAKCFDGGSTANCCTIFVDDAARTYQHWDDFCQNNLYGNDVVMVAPQLGVYRHDANDRVQLISSSQHHSAVQRLDKPATFAGLTASTVTFGAMVPFVAPLLPAVAVTAAVATGIACSGYAIGRGIDRLFNRKAHEQSIGLDDREARNVWLGVAGNSMGLAAGAAMQGVQMAARNGVTLNRAGTMVATSLNAAAIATNSVSVANGFYCMLEDRSFTYFELMQLSGSLFLITHSVRNFQTARAAYVETQQNTLQSYASSLSKNQQRMYTKMLKETIRLNGETGHADVIRSLRSIGDHKGFFRDLFKINPKLNENKVKISFGRSGRPVLNGEVAFDASQLRADLRSQPGSEVFANLSNNPVSGSVYTGSSTAAGLVTRQQSTESSAADLAAHRGLVNIANSLSVELQRRAGNFTPMRVVMFIWRYYQDNKDLIHDQLHIHFDDRFVDDVFNVLRFIAGQAHMQFGLFVETVAQNVLYDRLNALYRSRWLELTLRVAIGSINDLYEQLLNVVDRVRHYIRNGDSFREILQQLLEQMGSDVVKRLLRLSQISFGSILAMGLHEFPSFEAYFGEMLDVIMRMARENGFSDLSLYVLLIERSEIAALHERVTSFYQHMSNRARNSQRCGVCAGSFSVEQS